jgi:hypothetical protein
LNCCGAASGTWGAKLAEDFKKALNNESVKIKSRNNIDSKYGREPVGGFCDDIVCAYFIDHDTAIFFVGCLVV